jgi:hypothetical protein
MKQLILKNDLDLNIILLKDFMDNTEKFSGNKLYLKKKENGDNPVTWIPIIMRGDFFEICFSLGGYSKLNDLYQIISSYKEHEIVMTRVEDTIQIWKLSVEPEIETISFEEVENHLDMIRYEYFFAVFNSKDCLVGFIEKEENGLWNLNKKGSSVFSYDSSFRDIVQQTINTLKFQIFLMTPEDFKF